MPSVKLITPLDIKLRDWIVDVEEKDLYNSKYFNIVNLESQYSIGKHYFGIRGTNLLKQYSELYIEIVDDEELVLKTYSVDKEWANKKGIAIVGFEIEETTNFGKGLITFVGETTDNKWVKWKKELVFLGQYSDGLEGYANLSGSIPVEVSGTQMYDITNNWFTSTGILTSSTWDLQLRWVNHKLYPDNVLLSQSQGNAHITTSDATVSVVDKYTLDKISNYHIFAYAGNAAPKRDPNYYPIDSEKNGNWYHVGTIPVSKESGSLDNPWIEYTIPNVPGNRTYYLYVAMTTDTTLRNWDSNLWSRIPKKRPQRD